MPSSLPPSVLGMLEFHPLEQIIVPVLRARLPDVPIYSLVPLTVPDFFVLVRQDGSLGGWNGDPRFLNVTRIRVDAFVAGLEADADAARLAEAVRIALHDAARAKDGLPGLGSIAGIHMTNEPTKKTDWQTATGPVQYADLPLETERYEAKYRISIRRPL